jgi:hypothetical protein
MEQSVPKRRHIKFRHQGITQKKTYNILQMVYQLLQFNDGSLTVIRDDLLLCVSVCGKHSYLQNPGSNR